MLLKVWQYLIVKHVGCSDGRFCCVELGKSHLAVGINEDLLVDTANTFEIAHMKRVLRTPISWMSYLDLAAGFVEYRSDTMSALWLVPMCLEGNQDGTSVMVRSHNLRLPVDEMRLTFLTVGKVCRYRKLNHSS